MCFARHQIVNITVGDADWRGMASVSALCEIIYQVLKKVF